jgi:hypothetical protein
VDIVGVALIVALLVCPLMMLLMHRGMTHRQRAEGRHGESLSELQRQREEIEAAIRAREEAGQSPAEEEQASDRRSLR